jgi:hypothetical protein
LDNKNSLRNEIIKCGRDPVYFVRTYVKIKHPVRGLIPFKLFDYQEQLIRDYKENRFNVILKARQLGISEVTAAYACWLMLFHKEKNIIVMASKLETAKNIIRKVITSFKKLPKWLLLADVVTDNKLSVELSNGSRIAAIATSEDAGRSEAVSFLIIDEAAFVPRFDELWTGLYSTVAAGGSAAVLSTPNGVGNKFHEICSDAEESRNEFKFHRFMWWLHPDRAVGIQDDVERPGFKTSPWFKNEIAAANMSPRDVAQELECNFNASGDTVVAPQYLRWMESCTTIPQEMKNWDRNLHVFQQPRDNAKYLISADVARGDGKDNSAFHVFDIASMTQVAEYYGKTPLEEFAALLCDTGHEYGTAILAVENTAIGMACLEHIKIKAYENVYYSRRGDQRPGDVVNTYWGTTEDDLVPGFTTSQKNRSLMISKLEEYIRNRNIYFYSKRLVEELRTFIWNNGRPEAMKTKNDDLVMAAAIGIWLRDTFLTTNFANVEMKKSMLDGIGMNRTYNTQIEGASKNPTNSPVGSVFGVDPSTRHLKMRLPFGKEIDFAWLISSG